MVSSILSLLVGALTLSLSTALLYATGLSGETTPQFLALLSVCSLGFAALSGWLTALVSQRAPLAHALVLALLLTIIWGLYTLTGDPKPPLSLALLNGATGTIGVVAGGWIWSNQLKGRDRATLKPKTQSIKP